MSNQIHNQMTETETRQGLRTQEEYLKEANQELDQILTCLKDVPEDTLLPRQPRADGPPCDLRQAVVEYGAIIAGLAAVALALTVPL